MRISAHTPLSECPLGLNSRGHEDISVGIKNNGRALPWGHSVFLLTSSLGQQSFFPFPATSKDSRVREVKTLSKTTESHTRPSAEHCLTQLSDIFSQAWAPVSPAPGDYFTTFPILFCISIKEMINGPFGLATEPFLLTTLTFMRASYFHIWTPEIKEEMVYCLVYCSLTLRE